MKKYFLHDGKDQKGPYDIEALRQIKITKDTPIWYEGLDNWINADKIDELKDLFKTNTPPPFKDPVKPPPPFEKTTAIKTEEKNSIPKKKKRTGLIITLSILLILVIGAIIMGVNNPNAIPGVKIEVNTPKPVVVTSRADESKSGLFNARLTVYATIINQGGDGNVLLTFNVTQGSKNYDRNKSIYLSAGQSQDVEVTFEEVNYLDGEITYDVQCRAE